MRIVELSKENRTETLRFLKAYEGRCVALMEKVLKNQSTTYLLVEKESDIVGVFNFSLGGSVLHCLPFAQKLSKESKRRIGEATEIFSPFFAENEVFCINGETDGSILIENAIRLAGIQEVAEARSYYRMEYEAERDTIQRGYAEYEAKEEEIAEKNERADYYGLENTSEKPIESKDGTLALKNTGEIIKCTAQNFEELVPLQFEYEKVEVLIEGMEANLSECRLGLIGKLKSQDIYANVLGGEIVAKAGTNAKGINWIQIGGVYTKPLYRKLGIAAKLVSHIAQIALSSDKQVTLFVRELNTKAFHSYERAGFVRKGSWRIVYYKE